MGTWAPAQRGQVAALCVLCVLLLLLCTARKYGTEEVLRKCKCWYCCCCR